MDGWIKLKKHPSSKCWDKKLGAGWITTWDKKPYMIQELEIQTGSLEMYSLPFCFKDIGMSESRCQSSLWVFWKSEMVTTFFCIIRMIFSVVSYCFLPSSLLLCSTESLLKDGWNIIKYISATVILKPLTQIIAIIPLVDSAVSGWNCIWVPFKFLHSSLQLGRASAQDPKGHVNYSITLQIYFHHF